jgi:hypothetical protein
MSLKPAVKRSLLLLLSGLFWAVAGIILVRFALLWLLPHTMTTVLSLIAAGLLVGMFITRIGFRKVVENNIERIRELSEWPCLFAFQAWHSYLLIAVMISMGVFLRHTHYMPRLLLAVGYLAIGSALLRGSWRYLREWRGKKTHTENTE